VDEDINGELGGRRQFKVVDVYYCIHRKKGMEGIAPPTMRVDYSLEDGTTQSEWVCFEHTGYARTRAESWWRARSNDPVPDLVAEAVDIANNGGVAVTEWIVVEKKPDSRYASVVLTGVGAKPERPDDEFESGARELVKPLKAIDWDDLPF
jgi:DNA repair protein RadD